MAPSIRSLKEEPAVSGAATPEDVRTLNDGVPLPTPDQAPTLNEPEKVSSQPSPKKGIQFWLIIVSLMVSMALSALDLTTISTALPTIVEDLHGTEFVWVGSAFTLGSTAILPLTGGLAQIFGRRPVVLGALIFFAAGSALCGAAPSMSVLIAGRTIQGVGGGGILSMSEIIVADLVPLRERGTYMGLFGAVWAIASAVGPPIGGAFAQSSWRWLFYMNLPLCAISIVLVFFFLRMKVPQDDFKTKMRRMDWIGNFLVIISTTISVIALTWAGVKHPWSSYQVLVPLVIGIVGLFAFLFYEAKYAREPVVPWQLVNNRTSLLGYLTVFLHGIVSTTIIYYLPTYFQGALVQKPVQSGISIFPNAFTIAPAGIICGVLVTVFGVYRPQNFVGWALTSIGVGLLTLLRADTPKGQWVGYQLIEGLGLGFLYAAPTFPVLAALPVTETAHALAFFTFVRAYSQTWGVTIGATILQNELKKKLPPEFLAMFPKGGVEIAYAVIPTIPNLQEPLKGLVRTAFADSIRVIWLVMIGLCVFGTLSIFGEKELKMHEITDEDWGLEEKQQQKDEEKA